MKWLWHCNCIGSASLSSMLKSKRGRRKLSGFKPRLNDKGSRISKRRNIKLSLRSWWTWKSKTRNSRSAMLGGTHCSNKHHTKYNQSETLQITQDRLNTWTNVTSHSRFQWSALGSFVTQSIRLSTSGSPLGRLSISLDRGNSQSQRMMLRWCLMMQGQAGGSSVKGRWWGPWRIWRSRLLLKAGIATTTILSSGRLSTGLSETIGLSYWWR